MPIIRAVAKADAEERAFWERTIAKGRQEDGDLETAIAILKRHGTLDTTRETALSWAAKAKDALTPLPDHEIKDMLSDLADYVVARIT